MHWDMRWLLCLGGLACATPSPAVVASKPSAPEVPDDGSLSLRTLPRGAQRFPNLGTHHRSVTAHLAEAQDYFDQGLRLIYGFNHDEAARSFAKAAELDPSCGMCFWGVSLALGPNYNVPMLADRAQAAWDALRKASDLSPKLSAVEQALIGALAERYNSPRPVDPVAMQPYNEAYAQAMREVAKRFPEDLDVQTLFAEALMNLTPWKLWSRDGSPAPQTLETVATLESVLQRSPEHPGANHYYIHAVEASPHPEKALPSAERLAGLIPGAGHIVHMPAHIYQRVGRYAEASEHNRKAAAVDEAYIAQARPFGYYPMYLGHNQGFLAYSESMLGRSAESLRAARASVKALPPSMLEMMPGMDFFAAAPLFVMVRFGRFDELLAEPRPDAKYPVLLGLWMHGQGMALSAKGRLAEARAELEALRKLTAQMSPDLPADTNSAKALLAVAGKVLEAEIAGRQKSRRAPALWESAVALEDQLAYSEPADWFYPIRHHLGAALLSAGRARQAEAVYREDLRRHPNNGWSLFGLSQAQRAQGLKAQAEATLSEFDKAWQWADVVLTASVMK